MSLLNHAKNELDAIGMDETDSMNGEMRKHILHMVEEFSKAGHSGFSSSYAIGVLSKLLKYEPLCPLTGDDDEWVNVAEDNGYPLYQNKRASRVFKNNGMSHDIDGIVFWEWCVPEEGEPFKSYFTNKDSRTTVTFPYTPVTEYREADPNRD